MVAQGTTEPSATSDGPWWTPLLTPLWTSQPKPEIKFLQFNFVSFVFFFYQPALYNPDQLVLIPVLV